MDFIFLVIMSVVVFVFFVVALIGVIVYKIAFNKVSVDKDLADNNMALYKSRLK